MKTFLFLLFFLLQWSLQAGTLVSRDILVLTFTDLHHLEKDLAHRLMEMPLNHLGLNVRYHSMKEPLPELTENDGIRGILTFFPLGTRVENPELYLHWLHSALDSNKKVVLLGETGFIEDQVPNHLINRLLRRLGIEFQGHWESLTYDAKVQFLDEQFLNFERSVGEVIPPYLNMKVVNRKAKSLLRIHRPNSPDKASDLVVLSSQGAYAAEGFILHHDWRGEAEQEIRQWYLNPFEFFRHAFQTDDFPKPDTTTLVGRRIYYSHIDGDGWNNPTLIEMYKEKQTLSSEVILREAILPFSDLPVTLAPIAAELDLKWTGTEKGQEIAREFFALPQVEAGTHTYSHPFYWDFFEDEHPEKERFFLSRYPFGRWDQQEKAGWKHVFNWDSSASLPSSAPSLPDTYEVPRAYANELFDINQEIHGSAELIRSFLPEGKDLSCIMWSGDTLPFEKAIAKSREEGLLNINGGDSRLDNEYPSYAWVPPLGRRVGKERVIYASNSNENTYTNLWTSRFYGFRHAVTTFERTDFPLRIKPCNVYYHLYSGERPSSLSALIHNLFYARSQELCPIQTSAFIKAAQGFYSSQLHQEDAQVWSLENRQGLHTLRFDHASTLCIDWERSKGLIGQRYCGGNLYVALDPQVSHPTIAVKENSEPWTYPLAPQPYLISSRWPIESLESSPGECHFFCQGFGDADQKWRVPPQKQWQLQAQGDQGSLVQTSVTSDEHGFLQLHWSCKPTERFEVTFKAEEVM